MGTDDICPTANTVLEFLKCMGLSWYGLFEDVGGKKSFAKSLLRNGRLFYIVIDLAVLLILCTILGMLVFGGRASRPNLRDSMMRYPPRHAYSNQYNFLNA